MNKILSFFILSVFLIVSSSHNIFMVFSDFNNFMDNSHKIEKKDHCSEKSEDNKNSVLDVINFLQSFKVLGE